MPASAQIGGGAACLFARWVSWLSRGRMHLASSPCAAAARAWTNRGKWEGSRKARVWPAPAPPSSEASIGDSGSVWRGGHPLRTSGSRSAGTLRRESARGSPAGVGPRRVEVPVAEILSGRKLGCPRLNDFRRRATPPPRARACDARAHRACWRRRRRVRGVSEAFPHARLLTPVASPQSSSDVAQASERGAQPLTHGRTLPRPAH